VKLRYIDGVVDKIPSPSVGNMIDTDNTTRSRVLECGRGDGTDTKVNSLLERHIISILCIEDTICEGTSGTNSKEATAQSGGIIVNVVE
jgi:hypothetical protein